MDGVDCRWSRGVCQHRINRRQRFDIRRRQPSSARTEHRSTPFLVGKRIILLIPHQPWLQSLDYLFYTTSSRSVVGALLYPPIPELFILCYVYWLLCLWLHWYLGTFHLCKLRCAISPLIPCLINCVFASPIHRSAQYLTFDCSINIC